MYAGAAELLHRVYFGAFKKHLKNTGRLEAGEGAHRVGGVGGARRQKTPGANFKKTDSL